MRRRAIAAAGCWSAVAAIALPGCGASAPGSTSTGRTTLTVYSSMPLQGPAGAQSESVVNAERLALAQIGGRVGQFTIKFVSLDDSTAAANRADPDQTSTNARKAAQDGSTIAYLGEGDGGASAVSIPILNEAGIAQVSPSDSASGLTRPEGADKGEPERYYPSGRRTFARVVPADRVQARAQVDLQLQKGCHRTFVVSAAHVFGLGLTAQFELAAKAGGLPLARVQKLPPGATDFRSVVRNIRASGADCTFFTGLTSDDGARLFAEIHAAAPDTKLFGSSGVAETTFTEQLPVAVQRLTFITSPTLDPRLYPPTGQAFFTTYRLKYGKEPELAAIFGYEAMKLTLLAIQNVGDKGNDRQAVIDAIFRIRGHDSPLGKYSIDADGDTTLSDYGAYVVKDGRLAFDKVVKPGGR